MPTPPDGACHVRNRVVSGPPGWAAQAQEGPSKLLNLTACHVGVQPGPPPACPGTPEKAERSQAGLREPAAEQRNPAAARDGAYLEPDGR